MATLTLTCDKTTKDGDYVFTTHCSLRGEMRIIIRSGSPCLKESNDTEAEEITPAEEAQAADAPSETEGAEERGGEGLDSEDRKRFRLSGKPAANATREELWAYCEEKQITFDKRWGAEKLHAAIDEWWKAGGCL